jgi:hypothetical protein
MKKLRSIVTQGVLAALLLGAAGPAIAAAQVDTVVVASKNSETIYRPNKAPAGCWTDEGYGRISSCDAG